MIQAYSASPTVGIDLADPIQPWFIPAVPAGKDQLGTQVSLSDPSVTITGAFHNRKLRKSHCWLFIPIKDNNDDKEPRSSVTL